MIKVLCNIKNLYNLNNAWILCCLWLYKQTTEEWGHSIFQFGHGLFDDKDHFFEHHIGQERDHRSSLMRMIVKRYLNFKLKIYGKRYTEMITHKKNQVGMN